MKEIWKPYKRAGRDWLEPNELNVDSYVSWRVEVTESYHECAIKLADCGRSIEWYFDLDSGGLAKMERVIGLLNEFRRAAAQAQKRWDSRPEK